MPALDEGALRGRDGGLTVTTWPVVSEEPGPRTVPDVGRRSRQVRERRIARERRSRQERSWRETAESRGCLFCRQRTGGFRSQEHVFAEALGNTELVLHPGVVCDRCNNETLSQLDKTIAEFMPISVRRTMLGVPSKTGRVPGFRFSEGTIDFRPGVGGTDPTLVVMSNSSREILQEASRTPDGRVELKWEASGGRRMTPRYASELSRALLKSALECAWMDHGELLLEARFDHIRDAVLGVPRDGFFVAMKKGDPNFKSVSLTYQLLPYEGETWRMLVAGNYFGIWIGTDSRLPGPLQEPPESLLGVVTFTSSDFDLRRQVE